MKKRLFLILILLFSNPSWTQAIDDNVDEKADPVKRNILTVGVLVGGISLVGADYEVRLHDYFGIHFGGGLLGYGAGINVHLSPSARSSFFSVSYEDAGFGILDAITAE